MAEVTLVLVGQEPAFGYEVPSASFAGSARTRFAAPEGYEQWILAGEVEAGSRLE